MRHENRVRASPVSVKLTVAGREPSVGLIDCADGWGHDADIQECQLSGD